MSLPREFAKNIQPVLQVNPQPELLVLESTVVNDIDITFTVPKGKIWKLLYGNIRLTTTATAGNRRVDLRIHEPTGGEVYRLFAANLQIASTTERYTLGQFGDVSETVVGKHLMPIPVNLILGSGFDINILEDTGVDVNDDFIIRLVVEESDSEGA